MQSSGKIIYARYKSPNGGFVSRAGRKFDKFNYLKTSWLENPGPGNYENILAINK